MRVFKWVGTAAGVLAFLALSAPAAAQNCAGFTDVTDDGTATGAFCPSVQWVKNRNITLGCNQAGTLYCPATVVTRLGMAAFMHRLGTALTPQDLGVIAHDSVNIPVDLSVPANRIRCAMTQNIPTASYPRRILFNNKVNLYNPTARVDILAEVVFSTDDGVTWTQVPDTKTYQTLNGGLVPADDVSTYQLGFYDIPGTPVTTPPTTPTNYRFALRVMRNPDAANPGTGNPAIYCINRPSAISRNLSPGSPPPFDISDGAPPREGRAALTPE